jgi:hypothetical protein
MKFCQSLRSNTAASIRLDDRGFSYPIVGKETPANPGRLKRSTQDIVEPVIPGPSKNREPLMEIASIYHIEAHEENSSDTMERSSQQAAPRSLLTGLAASNVLTHAEAEALVTHARGQVLTATEGDDIPLSARLAALAESLRLERKLKHSGSETDASVALQSSTGAVAANTTTDVHLAPHPLLKHSDSEMVTSQSSTGAVAANATTDVHVFRNDSSSSASTGDERRRAGSRDDGEESGDDTHERDREWEHEWERELARRHSPALDAS